MGEVTKIQWCDHTFNPWRGCAKVHAGCANCYAEKGAKRNPGVLGVWGTNGTRVVASEAMWREPRKWNKAAEKEGVRRRVFCASLADVFEDWQGSISNSRGEKLYDTGEEWLPEDQINRRRYPGFDPADPDFAVTMYDLRLRLFFLIDETLWLDWLLVTKRPENVPRMWTRETGSLNDYALARRENVWLLTSVSDQETADKMIPDLIKCRDLVPVLGLSAEPLLGPIDLSPWLDRLDWVIVGGESGHNARRCDLGWIRSIVNQCRAAGVPVFVKQLGAHPYDGLSTLRGHIFPTEPNWITLRDPKGGDPTEWPEDQRVREFPSVATAAR